MEDKQESQIDQVKDFFSHRFLDPFNFPFFATIAAQEYELILAAISTANYKERIDFIRNNIPTGDAAWQTVWIAALVAILYNTALPTLGYIFKIIHAAITSVYEDWKKKIFENPVLTPKEYAAEKNRLNQIISDKNEEIKKLHAHINEKDSEITSARLGVSGALGRQARHIIRGLVEENKDGKALVPVPENANVAQAIIDTGIPELWCHVVEFAYKRGGLRQSEAAAVYYHNFDAESYTPEKIGDALDGLVLSGFLRESRLGPQVVYLPNSSNACELMVHSFNNHMHKTKVNG